MENEQHQSFWCFKAAVLASVLVCGSKVLNLDVPDLCSYTTPFKKAAGTVNDIELIVSKKGSGLTPERHRNRIILYSIKSEDETDLKNRTQLVLSSISTVLQHTSLKDWYLHVTKSGEVGVFSDDFANKMYSDTRFWTLLKKDACIINDIPLDLFLTADGVV